MKIIKTKDNAVIRYLNDKIKEYIEKEEISSYTHELFIKWLRTAIFNPLVAVWVCMEDDKTLGYIIIQIFQSLSSESISVTQLFGDTDEIEDELLATAKKWAKENGINKVTVSTFHPKKWKSKGFEVKEHLLTMEV